MTLEDEAGQVREGESLDEVAVDTYMKGLLPTLSGRLHVTQFPGGASNLTYQLTYGDQAFILRRPPFGHIAKSAHDMVREAKVMNALQSVYPYVPKIIGICEDHDILGCDFYIMEKLNGMIPRQDMPKPLIMSEQDTRKLCLNVIDKLIELHKVNINGTELEKMNKGTGYVNRQITGWSDRYVKSQTPDATSFVVVMEWLKNNMPDDVGQVVIHNDFRFDNVVLNLDEPTQVIGVLDWEMATIGDPLMDLGNSLAYWVQADDDPQFQMMRRQPTHIPGMLRRNEVVSYYLENTGYSVSSFAFYEIYGLFRLAVIIQQIYYRYYHGQTKDKRFSGFVHAAKYLESRCLKLIEKESA